MNRLKPADTLNIFFSALLILITILFYGRIEQAPYLMLIYVSIILFQLVLVRISGLNRFLTWTRDIIFPVLSVLIIFDTVGLIVHSINPQDIDYLLVRYDYMLIGLHPTVYLERYQKPFITDMLQIAYSTYYFMPVVLGVYLIRQGQKEEFEKTLFFILLCFYLSYVGYMLFPALGPRYAIEHLHSGELVGSDISKTIQSTLNALEGVKRDAFPSGHTGIALTVLFLAFRYAKKLAWLMLMPVLLLIIATVYCRYHYVVDVIGGVILAIVTLAAGEVYYRLRTGRDHGTSV